jgi:hypothetical protein
VEGFLFYLTFGFHSGVTPGNYLGLPGCPGSSVSEEAESIVLFVLPVNFW